MLPLLPKIQRNVRARALFTERQKILVAVSGGLDSMALLHVLCELGRKAKWKLAVAHFNHQLRGRSSDADERLVRRTAKKLGLQIVVDRARVREFAKDKKISIEMAARLLRHDFLVRAAKRVNAKVIVLAHHADDQVELFFLRLFRGSGGEGLSGMDWMGPSPADTSIKLVRPLLDVEREELRKYAVENKVEFREDATNAVLDFQRNRIRHELLPLLQKKYQPAIKRILERVMDIAGAESEFITKLAEDRLAKRSKQKGGKKKAVDFNALPVALQRRCLRLQLRRNGIVAGFDLVEQLRLKSNRLITIAHTEISGRSSPYTKTGVPLLVTRDSEGMICLRQKEAAAFEHREKKVELRRRRTTKFAGNQFSWRFDSKKGADLPARKARQEVFDADKIGPRIMLRLWRPGDRFQPIGMKSAVKLQDIFTNEHVPREQRHKLTIGVTVKGELFWVEGLRIAERFKLTKETKRRLHWRWQRL